MSETVQSRIYLFPLTAELHVSQYTGDNKDDESITDRTIVLDTELCCPISVSNNQKLKFCRMEIYETESTSRLRWGVVGVITFNDRTKYEDVPKKENKCEGWITIYVRPIAFENILSEIKAGRLPKRISLLVDLKADSFMRWDTDADIHTPIHEFSFNTIIIQPKLTTKNIWYKINWDKIYGCMFCFLLAILLIKYIFSL